MALALFWCISFYRQPVIDSNAYQQKKKQTTPIANHELFPQSNAANSHSRHLADVKFKPKDEVPI